MNDEPRNNGRECDAKPYCEAFKVRRSLTGDGDDIVTNWACSKTDCPLRPLRVT